ncbi:MULTISPECIES: alpha/beta hydrolase [unclassified Bradyrhizobium]|uniref:alpha/beta fold hydrolase n=1 Tax=unclassified Bradyrhizobium TaxID=2631580 RepID=UPI0024784C93|nr:MULTISPECIES: alpha/beta hydrolase [unclassified Bradyrhizobium]WGR73705.1 alpha/beta hydrolase [Bradyrhizobium sp. ISRA426]WGR78543.1 alpha/beta hydrolase [Bradyrhizobium sp. ISRA430]WGR88944.1 alpha/beta hydrolase [Bradyrhizobium sp. ISRA432]
MITKDGRFAYEAAGDAGAIPLIFLHGIGGAARAWRHQLTTFGDRVRAIAWDMPGYGGSAPLTSVSIAALAEALEQFIAQIDATNPVLVGHSIGGMIVQKLLAQSPRLPRAVVLAQTSPAFGKADGDWQTSFIAARLGPLDRGETMRSLAPSLVRELVGDEPDPKGMELARECMASVPEASYRAMMLALIGFDQRSTLKDVSVPTLLLSGSKDNNAPAPMMAKMATYIPAAEYVELAGVGHLANLERPDAFDKALGGFLESVVTTPQVTAQ